MEKLDCFIKYKVCDACDYNKPQHRTICFISKIKKWEFPQENKNCIITRDAISDLQSLDAGEDSGIKYHKAKIMSAREIEWRKHIPSGKRALGNETYCPKRLSDGSKIKCFHSYYSRLDWDKPATTITMSNGFITSRSNRHPERLLSDGTYSNARVLTILELLRSTGLPDNWNISEFASNNLNKRGNRRMFFTKICYRYVKNYALYQEPMNIDGSFFFWGGWRRNSDPFDATLQN